MHRSGTILNDVAASILAFLPDTYFEKSPSGTGLRGFFRLSPDFAYDKTVYYKIMGDYGKTSNPEMLSTKFGNTNASGPSEEIAHLAGVRFVNNTSCSWKTRIEKMSEERPRIWKSFWWIRKMM